MIVGITGHQNIPKNAIRFIRDRMKEFVESYPEMIALTSLAKGADQMFAEISLIANKELRVIIPCENYVSTFDTNQSLKSYNELLKAASYVEVLPNDAPSEKAFFSAGKRIVEISDEIIAIWDGESAQGLGGTADVVSFAKKLNKKVTIFWPNNVKR